MFDEWQMYPVVWDSIRTDVNHIEKKEQYITGPAKGNKAYWYSRVLMKSMSLFESFCMRDLKIYTQSYGGDINFYRDEKDFEIDVILRTSSGK